MPGLHFFVSDGMIIVSNPGGSVNVSAGQFGFVQNSMAVPVLVPNNPALKFAPPPAFATLSSAPRGTSTTPDAVDCEVR